MKLTKYEHACFTVEKDGGILVVDPGVLSTDFISPENVVGVIITHEHSDHFDKETLAAIIDKNPDAVVIAPPAVTTQLETPRTHAAVRGEPFEIGPFSLEFFGEKHALIHSSRPVVDNIGVMINDLLYYPGDSFTLPGKPVDTLALPTSAPWLKVSEILEFLKLIKPRLAFSTHDALLSDSGVMVTDDWISSIAGTIDTEYKHIESPIEI